MAAKLVGKTALVTGGGVGIGRAIAVALASEGARIALTYRSHTPDEQLLRELELGSGIAPICVQMDATDEAEVTAAFATLGDELGQLNILVNNIGGLVERSTIDSMSFALWKRVLAVNLDSMFLTTHHGLALLNRDGGRVINIASLAGRSGGHAGATAYAATKAGVFGFTRGLAKELGPSGTTVNALAPGFIEDTPFHDTFTTAESKAETIQGIPMGRAGTPADVATATLWLADPATSFYPVAGPVYRPESCGGMPKSVTE